MTAPLDLEALKRVAEAATPGEWRVRRDEGHHPDFAAINAPTWGALAEVAVRMEGYDEDHREGSANALHIATFDPPTVLALIARVEAAETEVKTLEMTLPGLRQLIVEGRAAGFREAVEAVANGIKLARKAGNDDPGWSLGWAAGMSRAEKIARALAPRDEVAG